MPSDKLRPALVPGEIWYPRPVSLGAREILGSQEMRRGGEAIVCYRTGNKEFQTDEASFQGWIAAFAASLEPQTDEQ